MAHYENILYEVADGFATVSLNRPERRNALSSALLDDLEAALWDADDDKRVHCVVIKGEGPSFCSGYDLKGFGGLGAPADDTPRRRTATIDDDSWQLERSARRLRVLWDMHKPTIAQVHGHCLAGGTDLALFCDLVISADDALIGFPPARNLGSLPNSMWLYHVGPQWAKRLTMTGDLVTGTDAATIGLVLKSVPSELLDNEVRSLAARMALIDPDLLSSNKRVINMGMELMGARTLQRYAAETDARAHRAPATREYFSAVAKGGLRGAFVERDAKFGDPVVRVGEPEVRDELGRVLPGGKDPHPATIYNELRQLLSDRVGKLATDDLARSVPSCPEWSIQDVLAHVIGIAEDVVTGNTEGLGTDAWTEAQVGKRRGRSVGELVDEWASHMSRVDEMVNEMPFLGTRLSADLVTHLHDVQSALGEAGDRANAGVRAGLERYGSFFCERVAEAGLAAVRVVGPLQSWESGPNPAITLRGSTFELLRAFSGRRSLSQVAGMNWSGDPTAHLAVVTPYGLPEQDVIE